MSFDEEVGNRDFHVHRIKTREKRRGFEFMKQAHDFTTPSGKTLQNPDSLKKTGVRRYLDVHPKLIGAR